MPSISGAASRGGTASRTLASSAARLARSPNSTPGELRRDGAIEIARQRDVRMARVLRIADPGLRPLAGSSSIGTVGSAATETNEELAPFSSSRRTR